MSTLLALPPWLTTTSSLLNPRPLPTNILLLLPILLCGDFNGDIAEAEGDEAEVDGLCLPMPIGADENLALSFGFWISNNPSLWSFSFPKFDWCTVGENDGAEVLREKRPLVLTPVKVLAADVYGR